MTVTVCFDALGTCFSLQPVIEALDSLLGLELRLAGSDARMTIMDWFHAAQRDYTYRSITSPPPPPMAKILTLSLHRAITLALGRKATLNPLDLNIPDLSSVTSKLTQLTPQPGLEECFKILKQDMKGNVLVITNGARSTTEGYISQAGLEDLVDDVRSCDEVGLAKPFAEVYERAHSACEQVEGMGAGGAKKAERWFVAAHMWDLAAARKAGFKTGYVLAEQPPLGQTDDGKDKLQEWWNLYGGEPDVVGSDLAEVAKRIKEATR